MFRKRLLLRASARQLLLDDAQRLAHVVERPLARNRREHSAAKPQPEMTESWPDRIIEEWRPSVAFRMILSRHDSVCFVPLLCRESTQAASKWKDCSTEDTR
jgi:hypothetical protein